MIDIQTALYNILHSRYGKDVRQSIHDGIYQINENANEAVQTAKAMGVGTAVSSSSSSSAGYVAGNLYLNNSTWDLWKCIGTNSWQNCGNVKGATGATGADGTSNYIFIRYSQYYDGTDFTASPTASSQFMGVYYGSSATAPTNKQDYQWTSYVGAAGTSAYVHIRYSENADGSDFVSEPTANTKYIGFYSGTASSAPANKSYYTWSEYVGRSGTGTGDMLKSEYAGSGVVGKVDNAINADNATNATNATNASNLKKTNGETISADSISTKILNLDSDGKIDYSDVKNTPNLSTKIDKPATASEGQVLTFDGSSWVAEDASASITEPTELEKGIIGGDEWTQRTYIAEETCIYNNKVWLCVETTTTVPSETDTIHWKLLSLKTISSSIPKRTILFNGSVKVVADATANLLNSPIGYDEIEITWKVGAEYIIQKSYIAESGSQARIFFYANSSSTVSSRWFFYTSSIKCGNATYLGYSSGTAYIEKIVGIKY